MQLKIKKYFTLKKEYLFLQKKKKKKSPFSVMKYIF